MNSVVYHIYTDGSFDRKTGIGVYGYCMNFRKKNRYYTRIEKKSSSTRCEMLAIISAVERCLQNKYTRELKIFTDSMTSIKVFNAISRDKTIKQDAKNKDILLTYLVLKTECDLKNIKIKLIKVKAHAGIELNERIDSKLKKVLRKEVNKQKLKDQRMEDHEEI